MLCSASAALREVLCAFTARVYTPTQPKSARAVTCIHCNKLRCAYVQRALRVTHMLAYATVSVSLAPSSSVDFFFLLSLRPIPFIHFSLPLSRSHSYIIYIHVCICVDICIPRFFLFSAFLLSLFVGQRLYPWSVHISSNQIYAPKCAHMRPWRVACGCRPRARCTFCSRDNLRLLCVARVSAGTLRPFRRFATTSFSIHAVEQRWYEKNVFRKWKCLEFFFDNWC